MRANVIAHCYSTDQGVTNEVIPSDRFEYQEAGNVFGSATFQIWIPNNTWRNLSQTDIRADYAINTYVYYSGQPNPYVPVCNSSGGYRSSIAEWDGGARGLRGSGCGFANVEARQRGFPGTNNVVRNFVFTP